MTIGCNIYARPDRYLAIDTKLDFINLENAIECPTCGRHSRVPRQWEQTQLTQHNTASCSNAADTDTDGDDTTDTDESDTDPEATVIDTAGPGPRPTDTATIA